MIAKKCTMRDIETATGRTGLTLIDAQQKGPGIRFRLGLASHGRDTGGSGRTGILAYERCRRA